MNGNGINSHPDHYPSNLSTMYNLEAEVVKADRNESQNSPKGSRGLESRLGTLPIKKIIEALVSGESAPTRSRMERAAG